MAAITLTLDDAMAEELQRVAIAKNRSETEIVREAVLAYIQTIRPLPKGMGNYRSGQTNTSQESRDILRKAAKDGLWP